jgi:predicted ATPase
VRLTPLVGRERELDDIAVALRRTRLITLTGPGGAGKTRLALAAAQAAEESFPAGARWVALAQIEDPGIAAQAVASQLGVPDTPGQDTVEATAKHLAGHQVLVVLDNCEHLAEVMAALTEYLLAACPALAVLATSREALGVEGELSWQVPPLSLPPGPAGAAATGAMPVMPAAGSSGPGLARAAHAPARHRNDHTGGPHAGPPVPRVRVGEGGHPPRSL